MSRSWPRVVAGEIIQLPFLLDVLVSHARTDPWHDNCSVAGRPLLNARASSTCMILLNCSPFRPDSRHKQKGSSTGLRTCVTPPGSQEESLFDGVEVWCGHVFGFFCGEAPPPASMDYASSIHFRLTCCQHLSSIRFSEPRSNSSAIQSLDLHCCAGIRQAGCM